LGDITEKPYYTAEKNSGSRRIQTKYTLAINSRGRKQKYRAASPSRDIEPRERERKRIPELVTGREAQPRKDAVIGASATRVHPWWRD